MAGLTRLYTLAILLAGALIVTGCDDQQARSGAPATGGGGAGATAAAAGEALPAGLIVAQAPADARGVADVRKVAADGEEVTVRGRIAGSTEPFTEGRAQFQLVDAAIKSCRETEGDACPTPWDMCCEDRKTVAANSLTVQVAGPDGRPLKAGLKGVSGLEPLSEVSVQGKVQKSADGKAVTVNATELYVKPQG